MSQKQMYHYKIKIMNKLKSLYIIKLLVNTNQCAPLPELRSCAQLRGVLGYIIEPGHGLKCKLRQLYDVEDLVDMYALHKQVLAM